MMENLKLVVFSFTCSLGLGIVFRMDRKNLLLAGLGGALTRVVYLAMLAATDQIFPQCFAASIFAALYAEIMAMKKRMPSTVFLYPSIIPLIPGGTLYNICVDIILGNRPEALEYTWELLLSLAGICLGFVLISTFTYYRKLYAMTRTINLHIRKYLKDVAIRTKKALGDK